MAVRRFAESEELFGIRTDRDDTGPLDGVADAALDRSGDTRSSVYVDAGSIGEKRIG